MLGMLLDFFFGPPERTHATLGRGGRVSHDPFEGTGPDGGGYRSMSHGAAQYVNETAHGVAPTRPYYRTPGDLD